MILTRDDLPSCVSPVLVDGYFDPLHAGHVQYFRAARTFGPLVCHIASGGKHPPLLPVSQRAIVIEALEMITDVHIGEAGSAEVIQRVRPQFFIKGTDWEGRLPADVLAACAQVGTSIRYVDTVIESSSSLRRKWKDA